jgi:hypothetical protein
VVFWICCEADPLLFPVLAYVCVRESTMGIFDSLYIYYSLFSVSKKKLGFGLGVLR